VSRDCGVAVGRIRLVDAGGADHPIDAVFEVSVDGGRGDDRLLADVGVQLGRGVVAAAVPEERPPRVPSH